MSIADTKTNTEVSLASGEFQATGYRIFRDHVATKQHIRQVRKDAGHQQDSGSRET